MVYPTPNFAGFMDLFGFMNSVTGNMYGYLLIGAFFMLVFISLKSWPTERALLTASMFTTIVAVLMSALNIVNPIVIAPLVLITAGTILFVGRDE